MGGDAKAAYKLQISTGGPRISASCLGDRRVCAGVGAAAAGATVVFVAVGAAEAGAGAFSGRPLVGTGQ